MPEYKINTQLNIIELYFEKIPDYNMRDILKSNKWHWNSVKLYWQNCYTESSLNFAKGLCPHNASKYETQKPNIQRNSMFLYGDCGNNVKWFFNPLPAIGLHIVGFGDVQGFTYDTIKTQPWYEFRDKIQTITIYDGVRSIGKRAFYKLENLETVKLSKSIIAIGDKAFAYCKKLKNIELPDNLQTIGSQAFRDCVSIEEMNIPPATNIGNDAFKGWISEQSIYKIRLDQYNNKYREQYHSNQEVDIYFEDFVSISNINWCENNNHRLENIQAKINIIKPNGDVINMIIPGGYCRECHKYFIENWQYEKIKARGIPLCQIVKSPTATNNHSENYYDTLSAESILHRSGYNVSSDENLTDKQRQQILILLVESGMCSKHKISSHLSWLIQQREGSIYLINAVSKWKRDRDFIVNYKLGSGRVVAVRSIKIRR